MKLKISGVIGVIAMMVVLTQTGKVVLAVASGVAAAGGCYLGMFACPK